MNRLARLITNMRKEDLLLLQKDLDSGNIERLIAKRLQEFPDTKTCPVCGAHMHEGEALKIEFGPKDLRQRAYFDGNDCLQFFIKSNLSPTTR